MSAEVKSAASSLSVEDRKALYETMVLSRRFETEAERQYKAARIGGYCHLSSGQEATAVGSVAAMNPDDYLVTGYRCHGFALARGISAQSIMAELFGREDGCAHGRGGSMHLLDVDKRYYGGWGIVAGQLPIATGLALGIVRQARSQAVLCELGDGAVNMGAWHESLNLAALWDLPVVFLVVNNAYGMGTGVERSSAEPEIFRRAEAHRIHGERIDGNDLAEVHEACERLMEEARKNRRPAVVEAMTYRYRGHSVADAGLAYRSKEEISTWSEERDPIEREKDWLLSQGASPDELDGVDERARHVVEAAVEFASGSKEPEVDDLAKGMYSSGSAVQFDRMRPGSPFGESELTFNAGLGA